jgi:hypothetical protein
MTLQLHDFLPKTAYRAGLYFAYLIPSMKFNLVVACAGLLVTRLGCFFSQHFQVYRHNTCKNHNIFRGFSYSSAA